MRLQLECVQVSCFASLHMHTQGNQQTMHMFWTVLDHSEPFGVIKGPFWPLLGPVWATMAQNGGVFLS